MYTLAAPGYEITLNVLPQSDDLITVVWQVPDSVRNQRLLYFDVIVEAQNTDTSPYRREQRVYVMMSQPVYTQVFDGLGWSKTLADIGHNFSVNIACYFLITYWIDRGMILIRIVVHEVKEGIKFMIERLCYGNNVTGYITYKKSCM